MPSKDFDRIHTSLAQFVGDSADPEAVASTVVTTLQSIDLALRPVLGQRGVAALYGRCLHLSSPAHAWLGGLHENTSPTIDFAALGASLARRDVTEIVASGDLLLRTLHALLVSLIGESLTDRLLADAAAHPSSGSPAQDPTT